MKKKSTFTFRLGLFFIWAMLSLGIVTKGHSQSSELDQARAFTEKKEFSKAIHVYDLLLKRSPQDVTARFNRAILFSWQKKYAKATEDFLAILTTDPENREVRLALAYTLGWSGNHREARMYFQEILDADPGNFEAQKGMAYIELWEGKAKEAIRRFAALVRDQPVSIEFRIALGQSYLLNLEQQAARVQFVKALELDPAQKEAQTLLNSIRHLPASWELDLWGGATLFDSTTHLGVRAFSAAWQPTRNLRFWGRYDNSLSLDNLSIVQVENGIPAWFGGAMYAWHPRHTTRLETGYRNLPGNRRQLITQGEHVIYLGKGYHLKTGAMYAPILSGPGYEALVYGGLFAPFTKNLGIEPLYFFVKNQFAQTTEHRLFVNARLQSNKDFQFFSGIMLGQVYGPDLNNSGTLYGAHLTGQFPLGKVHWLTFSSRYERSLQNPFLSLSAGLKLRFEK